MIMTIRIISNLCFGWLSPNNTYGYPPMFPINPSCWWLNTACLALLAPPASLPASPFESLLDIRLWSHRHTNTCATAAAEPPSAIKVGKSAMFLSDHLIPFDAVLWSGTSSLWKYMAIFLSVAKSNYQRFFRSEEDTLFPQEIANFATRNWHVGALQDDDLFTKSGPTRPEQQIHDGVSGFLCVFILMFSPSTVCFLIKIPITIPLLPMDWLTASWSNCNSIDFWNYFSMTLWLLTFPKIIWISYIHTYVYIYIICTFRIQYTV